MGLIIAIMVPLFWPVLDWFEALTGASGNRIGIGTLPGRLVRCDGQDGR